MTINDSSERRDFLRTLPFWAVRRENGHKGTFGLSVLIGGSRGMSGSVSMAGRAALATGSGLVRLIVPESIAELVAGNALEYMTVGVAADRNGRIAFQARSAIEKATFAATAVGLGPGLGVSLGLEIVVESLFKSCPKPLVLDADALNGLACRGVFQKLSSAEIADERRILADRFDETSVENRQIRSTEFEQDRIETAKFSSVEPRAGDWTATKTGRKRRRFGGLIGFGGRIDANRSVSGQSSRGVRILTPHPGEFARLSGVKISSDSDERQAAALLFARKNAPIVLILKGRETVISDGESVYVNRTGNAGMATGGSGDVLTGMITALLAQGFDGLDASRLAVALHGLAGDFAANVLPLDSIVAGDLVRFLPEAIGELRRSQSI